MSQKKLKWSKVFKKAFFTMNKVFIGVIGAQGLTGAIDPKVAALIGSIMGVIKAITNAKKHWSDL